jgi:hypothetical protein
MATPSKVYALTFPPKVFSSKKITYHDRGSYFFEVSLKLVEFVYYIIPGLYMADHGIYISDFVQNVADFKRPDPLFGPSEVRLLIPDFHQDLLDPRDGRDLIFFFEFVPVASILKHSPRDQGLQGSVRAAPALIVNHFQILAVVVVDVVPFAGCDLAALATFGQQRKMWVPEPAALVV